jgi:prevent-host-death family protein
MVSVGIRELKQQASELVRMVRENGNEIQITYHGTVVALLVPVTRPAMTDKESEAWSEIDHLAAEIGARWQPGVSALKAIQDGRR